jgi:phenylacetic acid degradation operon negative regulatory protein
MIITLYGDYIRHVGGSIQIGSLVRLLGQFGVSEQAVRSAISRMKRNGLLRVERQGNSSLYSLTPKSTEMIEAGALRIFQFPSHPRSWDGQWHLVTYSIHENERAARDRLRQELAWMGFGMLTNAVWISPHDHHQEIEAVAESLGVHARIEIFTARHDGLSDPKTMVAHCWNLPTINARYATFVEKFKPMYDEHRRRLANGNDLDASQYFVRRFTLIHEFRRFPFIDPELPAELLPADWRGTEAATLFRQYHDLLAEKANAFFCQVHQDGKPDADLKECECDLIRGGTEHVTQLAA